MRARLTLKHCDRHTSTQRETHTERERQKYTERHTQRQAKVEVHTQ